VKLNKDAVDDPQLLDWWNWKYASAQELSAPGDDVPVICPSALGALNGSRAGKQIDALMSAVDESVPIQARD
jgi:translation elongation factor EF-Tu-like GTPase